MAADLPRSACRAPRGPGSHFLGNPLAGTCPKAVHQLPKRGMRKSRQADAGGALRDRGAGSHRCQNRATRPADNVKYRNHAGRHAPAASSTTVTLSLAGSETTKDRLKSSRLLGHSIGRLAATILSHPRRPAHRIFWPGAGSMTARRDVLGFSLEESQKLPAMRRGAQQRQGDVSRSPAAITASLSASWDFHRRGFVWRQGLRRCCSGRRGTSCPADLSSASQTGP